MQPPQWGVVQEIIKIDNLSSTKVTTLGLSGAQEEILNCSLHLNPFQETEIPLN